MNELISHLLNLLSHMELISYICISRYMCHLYGDQLFHMHIHVLYVALSCLTVGILVPYCLHNL